MAKKSGSHEKSGSSHEKSGSRWQTIYNVSVLVAAEPEELTEIVKSFESLGHKVIVYPIN